MPFVNKAFEEYMQACFGVRQEVMPPEQHRELKRAFFGGFRTALNTLDQIAAAVPDTDAGLDAGAVGIELLVKELGEFVAAVDAGRE